MGMQYVLTGDKGTSAESIAVEGRFEHTKGTTFTGVTITVSLEPRIRTSRLILSLRASAGRISDGGKAGCQTVRVCTLAQGERRRPRLGSEWAFNGGKRPLEWAQAWSINTLVSVWTGVQVHVWSLSLKRGLETTEQTSRTGHVWSVGSPGIMRD